MNNSESISSLLHNQDCPFDYNCLAMDCLQCAQMQQERSLADPCDCNSVVSPYYSSLQMR